MNLLILCLGSWRDLYHQGRISVRMMSELLLPSFVQPFSSPTFPVSSLEFSIPCLTSARLKLPSESLPPLETLRPCGYSAHPLGICWVPAETQFLAGLFQIVAAKLL